MSPLNSGIAYHPAAAWRFTSGSAQQQYSCLATAPARALATSLAAAGWQRLNQVAPGNDDRGPTIEASERAAIATDPPANPTWARAASRATRAPFVGASGSERPSSLRMARPTREHANIRVGCEVTLDERADMELDQAIPVARDSEVRRRQEI